MSKRRKPQRGSCGVCGSGIPLKVDVSIDVNKVDDRKLLTMEMR